MPNCLQAAVALRFPSETGDSFRIADLITYQRKDKKTELVRPSKGGRQDWASAGYRSSNSHINCTRDPLVDTMFWCLFYNKGSELEVYALRLAPVCPFIPQMCGNHWYKFWENQKNPQNCSKNRGKVCWTWRLGNYSVSVSFPEWTAGYRTQTRLFSAGTWVESSKWQNGGRELTKKSSQRLLRSFRRAYCCLCLNCRGWNSPEFLLSQWPWRRTSPLE